MVDRCQSLSTKFKQVNVVFQTTHISTFVDGNILTCVLWFQNSIKQVHNKNNASLQKEVSQQ